MVWWWGASGALAFVIVFVVEGWRRPGYSPVRHTVSALATGPGGARQVASFVGCGALITAVAFSMLVAGPWRGLGACLAVVGAGLVASGVYSMDPMRGYPPGTPHRDPRHVSVAHKRHDAAGAVVFFSLPFTAAVGAVVLPGPVWTVGSAALAVWLVIAVALFSAAWERDHAYTGVAQRAVLLPALMWMAAVFGAAALDG